MNNRSYSIGRLPLILLTMGACATAGFNTAYKPDDCGLDFDETLHYMTEYQISHPATYHPLYNGGIVHIPFRLITIAPITTDPREQVLLHELLHAQDYHRNQQSNKTEEQIEECADKLYRELFENEKIPHK